MPNRNGMVFHEPLWKANGKGDVKNVACMKDCEIDPKVHSFLPDFARDAHGNIQQQNRVIGPVRGADTTKPAPKGLIGSAAAPRWHPPRRPRPRARTSAVCWRPMPARPVMA